MKLHRNAVTWVALIIAATQLLPLTTTQAENYKLADKTGAGIAAFRDEIVNVKKELDATMSALDKVVTTAATNPREAYQGYAKAVPKLDEAAKKAKSRAESMKAKGQAYFKDWEKELAEVKNPEIRKLAEERRVKLQSTFESIRTLMEPVRDPFNTCLSQMKDLQTYLNNDLTIAGIDAAKDLIAKTKSQGIALQQTMDKVIAELNTVVATLTPAKTKK